jgi:hypothetical protein
MVLNNDIINFCYAFCVDLLSYIYQKTHTTKDTKEVIFVGQLKIAVPMYAILPRIRTLLHPPSPFIAKSKISCQGETVDSFPASLTAKQVMPLRKCNANHSI